jgi:hypothetical protein
MMGGATAAEAGELIPRICGNRKAFEKVAPIITQFWKIFRNRSNHLVFVQVLGDD